MEKVLPELVSTDSDGYKSIAYGKLTAVLVEAIKEQQLQIESVGCISDSVMHHSYFYHDFIFFLVYDAQRYTLRELMDIYRV